MTPTTFDCNQAQTREPFTRGDVWMHTGYYVPGFVAKVMQELDRLAALPQNWDAQGAPPIQTQIIDAARKFIRNLPENVASIPAVVPSAEGNLQFEWSNGSRSLELEIESPATIHYLKWDPANGVEEERAFNITDIGRATGLIQWFMQGVEHV